MTGARIACTMDDRDFQARVAKLHGVLRVGTMKAIGVGLVKVTQERFEDEKEPFGATWTPLNPLYAEGKRGGGILRNKGMAGGLMGSITSEVGPFTVTVGSNKVYAAIQQFGGVIRPVNAKALVFRLGGGKNRKLIRARAVTIPARPYLGFGPADWHEVIDVLDAVISRTLGA